MAATAPVWEPGDVVLDLYEVRDVVRTGGMGLVYRVWHRGWGMDLAVKTPRQELVASPEQITVFEAEAGAWVGLGAHPHTVSCVYVRRLDGVPRVFAEWVDGGSLGGAVRDRRLYQGGQHAALRRILDVAIQFAWGLDHAHRQGLIHQDVKPDNAMITADGTVKVTDFGLARTRAVTGPGEAPGPLVTFAGMTSEYCSPEQARAARLSAATDVWSWAVSVLEMFVGRPPALYGHAAAEALDQFVEVGADDPAIPPMPVQVTGLLRRCLVQDPAARPGSLGEVAAELTRIYQETTGEPYQRELPAEATLLADGLSNQALSMVDLGRLAEADELWERALRVDPRNPHAVYNRGLRRWRAGTMTDRQLVEELQAVRVSHEGDWIGDYLLGLVHLERGDKDGAARLLGDAARLAPQVPEVAEARARADSLPTARAAIDLAGSALVRRAVLALSADGRVAATVHDARLLRTWEVDAGRCLRTLTGHEADIESVALSADGQVLASADAAGQVRVWTTVDGRCVWRESMPAGGLRSVALSGDGRIVATAGEDGSVRALDGAGIGLRVVSEAFADYGTALGGAVTVTADGRRVASFDGHRWLLRMWDLATGDLLVAMQVNRRFGFSPGGTVALALTAEDTVRVVDLGTGQVLDGGSATAWGGGPVAITDDGRVGFSLDFRFGLQRWELDTGRCVYSTEADTGSEIATSADGRVVLAGRQREAARIVWPPAGGPPAPWSYTRPRQAGQLTSEAGAVQDTLGRAGRLLDAGRYAAAMDELQTVRRMPGYRRHPELLALWQRIGAVGTKTGFSAAWPTRTFDRLLGGPTAVSKDLRRAIAGTYIGEVRIRDVEAGRPLDVSHGHDREVRSVALCADNRHAITTDAGQVMFMWDLETARRVATLAMSPGGVPSLRQDAGSLAVFRAADGLAYLWDSSARRLLYVWPGPDHRIAALDQGVTVTVAGDGHALVWDPNTGRHLHAARFPAMNTPIVGVSADGRVLAVAERSFDGDGTVFLSHTSWQPTPRGLTVAGDLVGALAVTPDGRLLLTGGFDGTVRLWDTWTGSRICDLAGGTVPVEHVALTADGCHALAVDNPGTVRRWELDWEYAVPDGSDQR